MVLHPRHLTTEIPKLMTHISRVQPTGLSKCGKVTRTQFHVLNGSISCVSDTMHVRKLTQTKTPTKLVIMNHHVSGVARYIMLCDCFKHRINKKLIHTICPRP
jgi:hypothetical protein